MSIAVHSDKLNVQVTKQQSILEQLLQRANQLTNLNENSQEQNDQLIRPTQDVHEYVLLDNNTASEAIETFESKFQQLIDVAQDAEGVPFINQYLENNTLIVAMPISVQPYMMPCAWQR